MFIFFDLLSHFFSLIVHIIPFFSLSSQRCLFFIHSFCLSVFLSFPFLVFFCCWNATRTVRIYLHINYCHKWDLQYNVYYTATTSNTNASYVEGVRNFTKSTHVSCNISKQAATERLHYYMLAMLVVEAHFFGLKTKKKMKHIKNGRRRRRGRKRTYSHHKGVIYIIFLYSSISFTFTFV